MQQALLIDEIIRHIFQFSAEDGPRTLSTLARSCRAWSDPALDYLWIRLSSVVPLLHLVSGVQLVDGVYVLQGPLKGDMARFRSYAQRVKYITQCQNIQVHDEVLSLFASTPPFTGLLPSLRTARLSASICDSFQTSLSLSVALRQIDLDLGFKAKTSDTSVCQYMERAFRVAPDLEKLSIRGRASSCLNAAISSMRNIRALSLHLGASLTLETLVAVSSFQHLLELEIHAAHFDVNVLEEALIRRQTPTLPSLQRLHIRAHAPVINLFLEMLPADSLYSLRVEAEEPVDIPISWSSIFSLISCKATNTLRNLTIEHHIELYEIDNDSTGLDSDMGGNDSMDTKTNTQIPFIDLQILRQLRRLQQLTFDTTLPPDLCDKELETLSSCWPELEHLDLGSVPTGCEGRLARRPVTSRSLVTLTKLSKLASLVLPADTSDAGATTIDVDAPLSRSGLMQITLGYPPASDPTILACFLHRLFPSLIEIDGVSERDDQWALVQTELKTLRDADKTSSTTYL